MRFELVKGIIIVDAKLNGSIKPMIVDTGAATTVIGSDVAQELRLPNSDQSCIGMGAGGDVDFDIVEVESLEICSAIKHGLNCAVMDMSQFRDHLERDVGGVVGHNFFSDSRLTIDYSTFELTIEHNS